MLQQLHVRLTILSKVVNPLTLLNNLSLTHYFMLSSHLVPQFSVNQIYVSVHILPQNVLVFIYLFICLYIHHIQMTCHILDNENKF